jgi:hypothetical protein
VDGEAGLREVRDDLLARHGDLADADARGSALALAGAHLLDPGGGRGRPMNERVVLPPAHAAGRPGLAAEALA